MFAITAPPTAPPPLAAHVDLRGLPKGTFKVRIIVVATDGRVLSGTRTYHTGAKRRTPRHKPKV